VSRICRSQSHRAWQLLWMIRSQANRQTISSRFIGAISMEAYKPGNRPHSETGDTFSNSITPESRAARLVAEYLRVWGLRDPQTIATISSLWVQRVVDRLESPARSRSLTELYRAVMREAVGDMEGRLDELTNHCSAGPREMRARRGLVAVELQAIVDQFPATLLGEEAWPQSLRDQLASAASPVVPPLSPTRMPIQSLEPIAVEYASRWRRVWNRLGRRARPQAGTQS
jgi:hypothetical protein